MSAGVYDIYIEQGSSFLLDITYKDDLGVAINLTGYLGRGQIRRNASSTDPEFTAITVTMTNAAAGEVRATLTPTQTEAMATKGKNYNETLVYAYDIEVYTTNDADVIRLLNGNALVSPGCTR